MNSATRVEPITEAIEKAVDVTSLLNLESDGDSPRSLFRTPLDLTREQEDTMMDWTTKRVEELEDALGRTTVGKSDWYETADNDDKDRRAFMSKRHFYDLTYRNDVEWRKYIKGGIFAESNLTVPLTRRIVQQQISRAINYFFGTDPWLSIYPIGASDSELAKKTDEFVKHKLEKAKAKAFLSKSIENAFIRGEQVVKTVHRQEVTYFETVMDVMVDEAGQPITDSQGGFIFRDDLIVPATDEMGNPTPILILQRDPEIVIPDIHGWTPQKVRRRVVKYSGPDVSNVYFKDFLCPLEAESIHAADAIAHIYDMPAAQVAEQYLPLIEKTAQTPEERLSLLTKLVEILSEHSDKATGAEKTTSQPEDMTVSGTGGKLSGGAETMLTLCEAHIRFDANGDGVLEDVTIIYNKNTKRPVYYDYTQNMTPDGNRPFHVVRVCPVDGRWYGFGAVELFETIQDIVDLTINRINFSQSTSARVDCIDPDAVYEGEADPNLEVNGGRQYHLKRGKKAEDFISSVVLSDVKSDKLMEFMEFFMQVGMNMSGVSQANDNAVAGMESTKLATGIRNLEKSGQELFAPYLSDLQEGLTCTVSAMCGLVLYHLDEEETFRYYEGDHLVLSQIHPDEVKNITETDIRLEMTRYRGEQDVAQNMAAADVVKEFYSLMPDVQMRTVNFYRQMLRAYQIRDVEKILEPLPLVAPGGQIDPNTAKSAVQNPTGGQSKPNL